MGPGSFATVVELLKAGRTTLALALGASGVGVWAWPKWDSLSKKVHDQHQDANSTFTELMDRVRVDEGLMGGSRAENALVLGQRFLTSRIDARDPGQEARLNGLRRTVRQYLIDKNTLFMWKYGLWVFEPDMHDHLAVETTNMLWPRLALDASNFVRNKMYTDGQLPMAASVAGFPCNNWAEVLYVNITAEDDFTTTAVLGINGADSWYGRQLARAIDVKSTCEVVRSARHGFAALPDDERRAKLDRFLASWEKQCARM